MGDSNITQRVSRKMASVPSNAFRFVAPTGNDHEVDIIAAQNARVSGVLTKLPRDAGDWTDIADAGVIPIEAGGAFDDGDLLIADSQGRAIVDPETPGVTAEVAGFAIGASTGAGVIAAIDYRPFQVKRGEAPQTIADPGNAGAIAVTSSGSVDIVTAAAETRTLAAPSFRGQLLSISMKTDGGDCVITCSTTVNQTGNNTITLNDAGDQVLLVAKRNGANLRWSVVANDGATLSTV